VADAGLALEFVLPAAVGVDLRNVTANSWTVMRSDPYGYVACKTYSGECKALTGFSWANGYFSLTTDFKYN
jgi:hypothetical protein